MCSIEGARNLENRRPFTSAGHDYLINFQGIPPELKLQRRGRRFRNVDGSAHEVQLDLGDTGGNVDSGLLLNRDRLQFDRTV
jgi:hypothetical protein